MSEVNVPADKVEVFKVEVGGKYIVTLELEETVTAEQERYIVTQLEGIQQALESWLEGGDSHFFVWVTRNGTKVKLEKVEG